MERYVPIRCALIWREDANRRILEADSSSTRGSLPIAYGMSLRFVPAAVRPAAVRPQAARL